MSPGNSLLESKVTDKRLALDNSAIRFKMHDLVSHYIRSNDAGRTSGNDIGHLEITSATVGSFQIVEIDAIILY